MRAACVTTALLLGLSACASQPAAKAPDAHASAPHAMSPAEIAARALPAVVTVKTAQSLGTGFVVRADGWVATNLHVVWDGSPVKITLHDGRVLEVVEVLAASQKHDLALLRVEAQDLPTLALGDSDAMHPGDPVVAIGNPLGLEDTVSNGLVSGRRKVDQNLEVLQVSAPIAPGSSGGPVFNDRGEVIAIAEQVVKGEESLAFGVPVHYLASMIAKPAPIPFAQFATLMTQLHAASTPKVRRSVPRFPVAFLGGCSQDAQKLVVQMIGDAIEAGAPLYNAGKPDACYHVYDALASDLIRKLPAACIGPARALSDAQKHAASLGDPIPQAWAMRDVFDGLLEVIVRRQDKPDP
jgi:S1-C subfamily serine protease